MPVPMAMPMPVRVSVVLRLIASSRFATGGLLLVGIVAAPLPLFVIVRMRMRMPMRVPVVLRLVASPRIAAISSLLLLPVPASFPVLVPMVVGPVVGTFIVLRVVRVADFVPVHVGVPPPGSGGLGTLKVLDHVA